MACGGTGEQQEQQQRGGYAPEGVPALPLGTAFVRAGRCAPAGEGGGGAC